MHGKSGKIGGQPTGRLADPKPRFERDNGVISDIQHRSRLRRLLEGRWRVSFLELEM